MIWKMQLTFSALKVTQGRGVKCDTVARADLH